MSLPKPGIRWATELDSFRGYWRNRRFVIIIIIIIIITSVFIQTMGSGYRGISWIDPQFIQSFLNQFI